jgi:hypothetical protein
MARVPGRKWFVYSDIYKMVRWTSEIRRASYGLREHAADAQLCEQGV